MFRRGPYTKQQRHNAAKFDTEEAARELNVPVADLLQAIYNVTHYLGYNSEPLVEFIDSEFKNDREALDVALGIKVNEGY